MGFEKFFKNLKSKEEKEEELNNKDSEIEQLKKETEENEQAIEVMKVLGRHSEGLGDGDVEKNIGEKELEKEKDFFNYLKTHYIEEGKIGEEEIEEIVEINDFGDEEEVKELLDGLAEKGYLIYDEEEDKYTFDFSADFRQDVAA